ncbi:hypothetical protein DPMN_166345 [Dreissena polymorpha]|uniref:Uncharacterized protein n=1 Tax=Dreissena polymorpha TaxID=45954 RepID=A0A9D4IU28_DREPO|nr:hypothetical protein DPMN_166345 [Dreissena polymorpha]
MTLDCRRVVKSVQPVRNSNPRHHAYRANALSTELTGPPNTFPPIPLKLGSVTFSLPSWNLFSNPRQRTVNY